MPATVNIYFDNRMSKDGEYYVKWVVYFDKKQKYVSTGLKLDKEDVEFLKKYKSGLTGGVRDDYRRNLWNMVYGSEYIEEGTGRKRKSYLTRGVDACKILGDNFTISDFSELATKPDSNAQIVIEKGDILFDMAEWAKSLRKTDNIGDAIMFECAAESLRKFWKKEKLLYSQISFDFLSRYERWMLTEGKTPAKKKDKDGSYLVRPGTPASVATIGMYLRQVKSMFTISKIDPALNPFKPGMYVIPSSENSKDALSIGDIEKIIDFTPTSEPMHLAKDLWLFSYFSNGLNFYDMLDLKWSDMDSRSNSIEFTRSKTKKTKKQKSKKVQINLMPHTLEIIERRGAKNGLYIFPFFDNSMSVARKKEVKELVVSNTNKYMRLIGSALNISIDITTYTARHSFATILMKSNAPLPFISQKLAHSSIKTTENYLKSFNVEESKEYLSALIPKKKEE